MPIMKKLIILLIAGLFLISFVSAENNNSNNETNQTTTCNSDNLDLCLNETNCTEVGGFWYNDLCNTEEQTNDTTTCNSDNLDLCLNETNCTEVGGFWYNNLCNEEAQTTTCVEDEDCEEGYECEDSECVIEEDDREAIKEKNRLKFEQRTGQECPDECICTGVVMKCELDGGGREMTVYAGRSGNIIVQVKGVNMSTKVTLYHYNNKTYGVFKGNKTKIIKILPDGVKEKIRQRIRARLEAHNITLDENGIYQVQMRKRARLFFLIPVRERVRAQIDAETGEIIKIRNPWWGFLARDVKEDIVGGCGTVTPGMEDECCQNLGYDSWNSEKLECE